jgi:hypothetical protein
MMAISDLAIWPRTKTLRYAIGVLDEMRLIFDDLESASFEPAKIRRIARTAKGRLTSAKATIENGIDDAVTQAVDASLTPNSDSEEQGDE